MVGFLHPEDKHKSDSAEWREKLPPTDTLQMPGLKKRHPGGYRLRDRLVRISRCR
jgi:hypothetical protein